MVKGLAFAEGLKWDFDETRTRINLTVGENVWCGLKPQKKFTGFTRPLVSARKIHIVDAQLRGKLVKESSKIPEVTPDRVATSSPVKKSAIVFLSSANR